MDTSSLMEQILSKDNLNAAYLQVVRNKGAAGVDGMTVEELGAYLSENGEIIRVQLRTRKYKPQPVRRVEIPKPDGGKRNLGVPVIDLTHVIESTMPVYPGTEPPTFEPANTYEKDGFKETRISMFTHTGTHMDPPAHLFRDRTTQDAFPPDQFIGKALVIDCTSLKEGEPITMEHLLAYGEKVKDADFLLFYLGWDERWGTKEYFGDYPCIDDSVLDHILDGNYKGIGFDVIGLDPIADVNLTRHKKLFRNKDIVNIENLCNLGKCGSDLFWFSCFPLKLTDCDGSPIRAVAWFE